MNPTPTVPLGRQESFWCETQNESGHKYHRLLTYMNEYEMGLADDCDNAPLDNAPLDNVRYDECHDTFYWTGWFEPSCEHCETHWLFHGKVLRWLPLPQFDAPAPHADTVRLSQRSIQLHVYSTLTGEWEPTIFEDVDLRSAIDAARNGGEK